MSAPAAEITHARVLRLALPIVISNATVPLLGLVDTGVVGRMGEAAPLGAVGVGAAAISAFYWLFGFLRMGTTGMVGQALGAGDVDEADALLARAFLVAALGGAALIALQVPLMALALAVSQAGAEVEGLTRAYIAIRIWSAPAAIAVYGITGWLVAQERTRAVLVLQVAMNGINIALDVWFVLGLGWGVPGVAGATLIAEWAGLALGLWYVREVLARSAWRSWVRVADAARVRRMMAVSRDILLRSVMLTGAFLLFVMVFSARQGTQILAANQVLMQFLTISAFALDGFAFAVEALVANTVGARRLAGLRRAVRLATLWAVIFAGALSLAYALGGGALIDLLTTAPEVRAEARAYLPWLVLAPLAGAGAFILDGVFIGATRGPDMRDMMAVSFVLYLAAVAVLLPAFGNHGLWAAMVLFLAVRGLTLLWRYPRIEAQLG
ncbi:MAG: MATE family efflux transporter [Shimia sp.]